MSKARQVWRMTLPMVDGKTFELIIPGPWKILRVEYNTVRGPTAWVECQPGWPEQAYMFEWFGTGQPIPDDLEHYATVLDGPFIWHLYGPMQ